MDGWIVFNAVVGWITGLYVLQYALRYANGKKPLRLIASFLILYFAFRYTQSAFGFIPPIGLSEYFRPWIWVFFCLFAYECRSDPQHRKREAI
jgi:hypothetical protein